MCRKDIHRIALVWGGRRRPYPFDVMAIHALYQSVP